MGRPSLQLLRGGVGAGCGGSGCRSFIGFPSHPLAQFIVITPCCALRHLYPSQQPPLLTQSTVFTAPMPHAWGLPRAIVNDKTSKRDSVVRFEEHAQLNIAAEGGRGWEPAAINLRTSPARWLRPCSRAELVTDRESVDR